MSLKIERFPVKLQEKAIELKGFGYSDSEVAEFLNKNAEGEELITPSDVYAFINKNSERAFKVAKDKGDFEKKMAKHYFDTINQMNALKDEMTSTFYDLKTNPDYKEKKFECENCGKTNSVRIQDLSTLIKTADHLLKQIQHVDSVLGKLNKKSMQITYNVSDINQKVINALPDILERMTKEGKLNSVERILKKKKKEIRKQQQEEEKEE